MERPWYQKLFGSTAAVVQETAESKAAGGDADAQFSLGFRCANRGGSALDYSQAAAWYLKAANQNHVLAQFNLGIMHSSGQGMPKDDSLAGEWFRKAAAQGDSGAQHYLGVQQQRASFTGQPAAMTEARIEAYKWFQLAAASGYKGSAAAHELLTQKMSHADVVDGIRRAEAFTTVHPSTS
ncbi:MAG: sel1 repeat family protein [Opitutaceae bacterium]|nr:sel1 repeat family protein [Verrucomicrobiales bacterium]